MLQVGDRVAFHPNQSRSLTIRIGTIVEILNKKFPFDCAIKWDCTNFTINYVSSSDFVAILNGVDKLDDIL